MAYHISNSPVLRGLLAPLSDAYSGSVCRFDCHRFGDLDFLEAGALRCIGDSPSGRGFLQAHADHGRAEVSADLFFKALKSRRGLVNLQSVNARLAAPMKARCEDPYAVHPELAGDGHFHAAACHDGRNDAGKKLPTGHLYLLDMRTHHLNQLTMARRSNGGRGNEHDMRALRRSETDALRQGAPAGRKVLIVWDRAGIDFGFWHRCKTQAGIYFISREKENMALQVVGNNPVDRSDARNGGVLSDELVGPGGSGGHLLRRVRYRTPEGEVYSYLTTELKIPPGLIALLYKQRWDIEKVFDQCKNKLGERKSWASSAPAKEANAAFLCLAHNLMVLLEAKLETEEQVTNEAERSRRIGRAVERCKAILRGGARPDYVTIALERLTVRSVKFVRWLRSFVYRETPWSEAIARLRRIYATL